MLSRMVRGALVGWLIVAPAGVARARPFEDAVAAYKRGDHATALRLYRPLADQGAAVAQYALGVMYANGQGVPQDYAEAVEWYRKAANQGNAKAQHDLGVAYAEGLGMPQNYAEAVKWYRKSADQGNAEAQHNLGVMCAKGQGMPKDYVQAHMWFNLAASRLVDPSEQKAAIAGRDTIAKSMTPAQIAEAQRLARKSRPPFTLLHTI